MIVRAFYYFIGFAVIGFLLLLTQIGQQWFVDSLRSTGALISGAALALFSITSVALSTSPSARVRHYGFICGLLGQPFWFYVAFSSHNLGLLINSTFFTCLWLVRLDQIKEIKNAERQ